MPESMTHPAQAHEAAQKPPEIQHSEPSVLGFEQAAPTNTELQRSLQHPDRLHPQEVLSVQRRLGNRAAGQLLRRGTKIQAKLTVGAANDPAEQEADRVAGEVLRMPAPVVLRAASEDEEEPLQGKRVQRVGLEEEEPLQGKRLRREAAEDEEPLQGKLISRASLEEEEPLQAKRIQRAGMEEEEQLQGKQLQRAGIEEEEPPQSKPIQRSGVEEEEESLQAKSEAVDPMGSFDAGTEIEQSLASQRGLGSPLPDEVRADLEPRFGADFSEVRIHTGSPSEQLSRELSAQAFTHGQDIYMGAGKYDPQSGSGRQLLAHELTHVIQQGGAGQLPIQTSRRPSIRRLQRKLEPANAKELTGTDIFETEVKSNAIVIKTVTPTPPAPSTGSPTNTPAPVLEPVPVVAVHVPNNTAKIVIDRDKKAGDAQYVYAEYNGKKGYLKESSVTVVSDTGFDTKYNAMTLSELNQYAEKHPDWDHDLASSDQRARVKKFIDFSKSSAPNVLGPCGGYTLNAMLAAASASNLDTLFEQLKVYAKAVSASDPFRVDPTTDVAEAAKRGKNLKKLIDAFPGYVLNSAIENENFLELIGHNAKNTDYTDDIIAYYTTSTPQPIFQALNGSDFESYLRFRIVDNGNPLDYHSDANLSGNIRNFHRFTKATLDQLKLNFTPPTTKTKPLTLILHTAIDHNGAFHRDPYMEEVVSDTHILTILIEGKETLGEISSEIDTLAATYGLNNKIDQVMFAGHGNSRSIELAGGVKESDTGEIEEVSDALDLDDNPDEVDDLLSKILGNMDADLADPDLQPHRRIVFNACLTNSNAVRTAVASDDWTVAEAEINNYIQSNPSLTTYMKQLIQGTSGTPAPISAVGANASIGEVGLIDPSTHALTLESPDDPMVSSLDKLDYVKEGHEAGGAMWALLESFAGAYGISDATQKAAALTRLEAALTWRVAQSFTNWDDLIVKVFYQVILAAMPGVNPQYVQWLALQAEEIVEMKHKEHCKPADVAKTAKALDAEWLKLVLALRTSPEWTSNPFIPLVFYEGSMGNQPSEAAWQTAFEGTLSTDFNCQTASEFVDFAFLEGHGLMDSLLGGTKITHAKLILALMAILANNSDARAISLLVKLRHPGAPEAPELPRVPAVPAEAPAKRTATIPKVNPAPGRVQFPRAPGTGSTEKRPVIPKINPLPGLPALGPLKGGFLGLFKIQDAGRPARAERASVPKVDAVEAFFPSNLEINKKLASRSTEDQILKMLPVPTLTEIKAQLPDETRSAAPNYLIPGTTP